MYTYRYISDLRETQVTLIQLNPTNYQVISLKLNDVIKMDTFSSHSKQYLVVAGYYYYIETSAPRRPGDKARFVSPQIPLNQPDSHKCFQFWYYMYGDHVDHLNVYMNSGNGLGQPVFTKQGTQGQKWIQASITLSPKIPFQVQENFQNFSVYW